MDVREFEKAVLELKRNLPAGTRIKLIQDNEPKKVTVISINDSGIISCAFDDGKIMDINPDGIDIIKLNDYEVLAERLVKFYKELDCSDYVDNLQIGENDEFVMKELEYSIRYSDTKLRRIIEFLDMLPVEELNDELVEELKSLKVELKDIYGQNQYEPIKLLYEDEFEL